MPMSVPRSQSSGTSGWRFGGQRRFFSATSSRVASTNPTSAALKGMSPVRIDCRVMRSAAKIGTAGAGFSPGAAQCTCRWRGLVGIVPSSSTMRVALDAPDLAEPHDALDAPQLLELVRAHGRAPEHRGRDALVDAEQLLGRLESLEQIVDRRRLGRRLDLERDPLEQRADELAALREGSIQEPGLARLDPADVASARRRSRGATSTRRAPSCPRR